jgi:tRNA(fMet)-specific endonuclease VapC
LYLLDTNILSHLVRQPQGPVADHIAEVGEANVLTSVIVACELRYGAAKRGSRKLTRQVEAAERDDDQTPRIGYRTCLCVD